MYNYNYNKLMVFMKDENVSPLFEKGSSLIILKPTSI